MVGGALADHITGGAGNGALSGDAGNDELKGDSGDDTPDGGDGSDHIEAGSGNDVAIYVMADNLGSHDKYDAAAGIDTLRLAYNRRPPRLCRGGSSSLTYPGVHR